MDNFEALVRLLLEKDNYWTRQSQKVNLTPAEKAKIGKPSIPRPEIDLIAFKPSDDKIIAMEVKSYLDSTGVPAKDFQDLSFSVPSGRYKLFTCPEYRSLVFDRLKCDYQRDGLADTETTVQLGLAAGKIRAKDEPELQAIFDKNRWLLWTPSVLARKTRNLAAIGYENDPFVLVTKLLERNSRPDS